MTRGLGLAGKANDLSLAPVVEEVRVGCVVTSSKVGRLSEGWEFEVYEVWCCVSCGSMTSISLKMLFFL